MSLINIQKMHKVYQNGELSVQALMDISLQIEPGEFVAIVGPSGSGKSTLMNILGCLDTPDSGSYLLDGENVADFDPARLARVRNRQIGFIFQGFNLIGSLNALENVELPLTYRKIPRRQRLSICADALARVGIANRMRHLPAQLSGGQQQRVAIARAIAAHPSILLADEPTGNLDRTSGNEVMDILHELNREGRTIILITHDEAIANTAMRVIRISDGCVVSDKKQLS